MKKLRFANFPTLDFPSYTYSLRGHPLMMSEFRGGGGVQEIRTLVNKA